MTKNEMKDLLFDILNEQDELFTDVTLSDTLDALIIKSIDKGNFILHVDYLNEGEEDLRAFARKNPVVLYFALTLLQLADFEVITEDEAKKYLNIFRTNNTNNTFYKEE